MAKIKEQKPDNVAEPVDIQNDEYRGEGGSYVFDPVAGKRTRVEEPDLGSQPAAESKSPELEILNNESQ